MKNIKGTINVFVALMLVPTLAFSGFSVDFARMRMAQTQMYNAADLAATSVLAYYDGLLKDVYGLYGTSQNSAEYLNFAEEYARTALGMDSGGKKADGSGFNLFMGSGTQSFNFTLRTSAQQSLRNPTYFRAETAQYMKYRIAFSISEIFNIVTSMGDSFEKGANGRPRVENDKEFIENDLSAILDRIDKLYDKYEALYEAINAANIEATDISVTVVNYERDINNLFEEIYESYDLDTPNYLSIYYDARSVQTKVNELISILNQHESKLAQVRNLTNELANEVDSIKAQINSAMDKLVNSDNYSNGFIGSTAPNAPENQKTTYATLRDLRDELPANTDLYRQAGNNYYNNNSSRVNTIKNNLQNLRYGTYSISQVIQNAERNLDPYQSAPPIRLSNVPTVNIGRYTYLSYNSAQYNEVRDVVQTARNANSDIRAARNDISQLGSQANQARQEAQNAERNDDIKNITDSMISNWDNSDSGISPVASDNFLEEWTINRVLNVEYAMQMFTDYTTNKRWEGSGTNYSRNEHMYMLTGVPFSKELNYLYQGELEYILVGSKNASTNRNTIVTLLSAYFFVQNYLYTFRDSEIKDVLRIVSMIPKIGKALAEAMRLGITIIESYRDISALLDGQMVPAVKNPTAPVKQWRTSLRIFSPSQHAWSGGRKGTGFYYRDYIRILLLLNVFSSNDTMAKRMINLVELNLNHHNGNANGTAWKANRSYVIVDAEITATVPYFFVSMPQFDNINLGLSQEQRTKATLSVKRTRGY